MIQKQHYLAKIAPFITIAASCELSTVFKSASREKNNLFMKYDFIL